MALGRRRKQQVIVEGDYSARFIQIMQSMVLEPGVRRVVDEVAAEGRAAATKKHGKKPRHRVA